MRLVLIVPPTGKVAQKTRRVLDSPFSVGGAGAEVPIDHPTVGDATVRVEEHEGEWTVLDASGLGRCAVGGVPLRAYARRILRAPMSLRLGDVECALQLDAPLGDSQPTGALVVKRISDLFHAGAVPKIRIAEGEGIGRVIALEKPCVIGRGSDADLILEDADVSRRHLSVEWSESSVIVKDLGSVAGTFLGRHRLEPHVAAVWPIDRMLRLGKTVLLREGTSAELLHEVAKVDDANAEEAGAVEEGGAPDATATSDVQPVIHSAPIAELPALSKPPLGPSNRLLKLLVFGLVALGVLSAFAVAWLLIASC